MHRRFSVAPRSKWFSLEATYIIRCLLPLLLFKCLVVVVDLKSQERSTIRDWVSIRVICTFFSSHATVTSFPAKLESVSLNHGAIEVKDFFLLLLFFFPSSSETSSSVSHKHVFRLITACCVPDQILDSPLVYSGQCHSDKHLRCPMTVRDR